ncbi:HAD-IB family hydrolase [Rhodoblastus sp.]|uniref:HAD-IB family hydrolase n=1 Tax=Rhodoblastus sp. TaxID=1962975 RepID=UPI0025D9A43D|nr:HAD-IB family hydrolase [Rhodoblastus sp.]
MSRDLALFDFDGALTRRDSLLPFLREAIGPLALARALAASSPWLAGHAFGLTGNDDARERLLAAALGGRDIEDLRAVGAAFARDGVPRLLRESMMAEVRRRRDEGRLCILVGASLDLYLEPWASSEGFDHVICSRLALDAESRATGALAGGSCRGREKVRRIYAWLSAQGAIGQGGIGHCAAYARFASDAPMLDMADEAFWVDAAGAPKPAPKPAPRSPASAA